MQLLQQRTETLTAQKGRKQTKPNPPKPLLACTIWSLTKEKSRKKHPCGLRVDFQNKTSKWILKKVDL